MLVKTMSKTLLLRLCVLTGVLFFGHLPKLEAQEAQESADLVLLIDGSENIGAANFRLVRDLALRVIEELDVGRDLIRVALVIYGADPEIKFYLNSYDDKGDIRNVVQGLNFIGGADSNLGAALEKVTESLLSPEAGGRAEEGVPQALVIISAGQATDDFSEGERALKQANVYTFGVAIGESATAELQGIASDRNFVLSAPDVRTLANMGDQLLPFIKGVAQRSIVAETEFTEALAVSKRDIIFLIDSSMGATFVNAVRDFIRKFIDTMPIGPAEVQIGVTMFSNTPRLEIDLNSYDSKESLISALARIKPRPSPDVNIGAALEFVRTNMLTPEKGSRIQDGVPQLVLLLTSKKSKDGVQQPAEALQRMGVLTMAAGSKAADEAELKQIAFDESLVFMLKDFRILLRNPRLIVSPLSTLSGVVVTEGPTEPEIEITTIQTQKVVRDFVFLVDGSNYVGNANLPAVRDFISSIVNRLDVRPERVRIGLIQFAERPRTVFYLNTHSTKQDVLASIAQLQLIGGNVLRTGAALQFALANHFQDSAGSRGSQGVQQVLVLITGGQSQDEVKRVADQVALAGVLTFAVGAGQAAETELRTVAFVPNLAYYEQSFATLPTVVEQMMTPLITVVGEPSVPEVTSTPDGERDVAFLIDGSDDVRRDFGYIRDFIIKVIEPLDVSFDKVRVAVVQHSDRPSPNFYLNTYKTKEEVLTAIRGLSPAGGRSLNTGAALKFMKDTILSSAYGSRASQNVAQFLIVLTGGKSRDSVKEPARDLKTEGVVPFGVGVKNADPKQIEDISHNPSFAFTVKEFSQLDTVQQKLNSYVSLPKAQLEVVLKEVELDAAQRDVVILLDGSDNTRDGFPLMCLFVQRMVDKLNIGDSRDRVSVVQYSTQAQVHFLLNTHFLKQDVFNSIKSLQHQGGSHLNIGAALDFIKNHVFITSSGSRYLEGVPQILILVTGGRSQDDVRGPAAALKQEKIVPFCVGTQTADIVQLQMISHTPSHTFTVPQFDGLQNIEQELMSYVKRVPRQPKRLRPTTLADSGKRDVVLLIDGSDNTRRSFSSVQKFVQLLAERLNIGNNRDQMSVVQYGDTATVDFFLNTHSSREEVTDSVKRLRHKGGRSLYIGAALQYVNDNVFTVLSGSRHLERVPQILVLLSTGRSRDDVRGPVKVLKEKGVISLSIGTTNADTLELQTVSHQPNNFFVANFEELSTISEDVLSFIKGVSIKQVPTMIPPGFESDKKDVAFLVDGSDDSRNGFEAIRGFVQKVIENLKIEENGDRVALVQYSQDTTANFYLNSYSNKNDVMSSVRSVKHKGGRPQNSGSALRFIRDYIFTPSSGGRHQEGIPQILYMFCGDRSNDDIRGVSQALREKGIKIFTIGTTNADTLELQTMSSTPAHAFSITDFNYLDNIYQSVANVVHGSEEIQEQFLTSEGKKQNKHDIVFLLDGSDGTRDSFPAMRDFVQRMVDRLNVSDRRDHVSVVQFSREPEAHFYLNTYTTKESVLNTVRGLRHRGGRPLNTGAALQYVRDNVFTASAGSRRLEGVPQLLILLSGGRSFDNIDMPASSLKELGVLTFAVGSRGSDSRELQKISYDPSSALSVTDFANLPTVQEQLFSRINTVHEETKTVSPTQIVEPDAQRRDVVFLLDGSDGTRSGFPAMKDFVLRVMEKLNVAEDKDRVSVVQFSRDPETHFNLNTYTRKDDVVDTVRVLKHKGGRPLNTGAALKYVRDNVFTASSGSRRLEGVPQILILLSGARSFDNVDVPASALKDLGVLIFTIGSRGSDSRELQKISHEPKYALSVSDFIELPNVQEQLVNTVEAVSVPITPASPTPTADFDISRKDVVFLLDGSDGTRNGFPAMLDFVQKVVEKLNVEESRDRVSVVQYSRDPEAHFYLNTYSEETDVLDTIKTLRHRGGRPLNTGSALQYVRDNVFTSSAGSRSQQGVPQILILLSGSRSNDNVDTPASALKESGVLILGVGTRNSSREIQRIVSDPSYAQSISEISDLPAVQQQFLSTLASTVSYVTPVKPTVIVEGRMTRRDVVFLLDGSDGTRDSFPAMRYFVQRMVDRLNVSDRRDRVSVVQFSREPLAHFYLNTYTTKESVLNTVRGLRHRGGRPLNTGAALQYVRDNVFTASSGSRRLEGVPQLLILLSGGRSFDNIDMPASSLKQLGVLTFAVGSRGSDSRELQKISYDPSSALSVTDFANLPTVQEQLFSRINTVREETKTVSPTQIVEPEAQRRDVVFLLDGSDGTRSGFPAMKDFVLRVMEKLNVAEDKDRVSVVQFSRDPETHFYLNTYTRKDDIVDTVRALRHKGGRPLNTGAALQYVRDNVFTASSGSRRLEGVPQILILLSGARSFDNVDVPASALKDLGVLIFTIGSRGSDSRELQKISHEPKYALSVSDFTELPNVQEQLVNTVEAVSVPITPASPTPTVDFDISRKDVVFLLDGSDGTRNGFPAMLDFVQKVVEKLNVEENRDRVSVVQYSRDPETHFYLNTYSEETDVLDTIKTLRHRGGRPLNTGSALQYVRDKVFTSSAGSRSQQGVPQILILLSGSRSNDNVDTPASALKESGVLILGVGTRNSSREIQRIVSDPSYAQSISEISDLPAVQQQFLSTLASTVSYVTPVKPTVIAERRMTRRDVVFLLDGSDGTRDSFPAMRDFVQRMVDRLNVSDRRDRVSVVQFSREPEAHFYLNTYTTKESVLNTVRGLRHRGGRPLNTGAALQYVRDNVFTASSGSRRLEGVPQLLILLSGGRSFDNIDMPASSLKELGVLTFAVGSRGSDSRELQKISYDPSSALSVTDFANLPTVQEQLFSRINTVREETKTVSPTQIGKTNRVLIHVTQSFTGLIFFKAVPNSPWYIEKSRNENVCSMQIMVM
ncbi:collagen alpha-3(VI) chain-like [Pygocentrus nattereri]|uniref:collagen alpha-3(VI) chain-like n=1 Tax=Pygocentrus nattereri TaxID=42514 RepID=UPI0018912FDF|nr:collagen alpha-3(VI) chain-like [Pygocentrus nattereri]